MVYEKHEKLRNIQNVKLYYNMPKSNIHPKWFQNTLVLSNGKPIALVGSTRSELQSDTWLGNHPFYTKSQVVIDSEGRVERFLKKYGLNSTDQ